MTVVYEQYEATFAKWQRAYKQGLYELQLADFKEESYSKETMKLFEDYMNQDLNVQNVMTLLEGLIKELNAYIRVKDLKQISVKLNTIRKILDVLGIDLFVNPMKEHELDVYKKWINARNAKDYTAADQYRKQLVEWEIV